MFFLRFLGLPSIINRNHLNIHTESDPTIINDYGTVLHQNKPELVNIILQGGGDTVMAQCFIGCQNLQTVIGSEEITHIGASAFNNCPSLVQLEFPGVITFERPSYQGSHLAAIRLSIEYYDKATQMPNLTKVIFPKLTTPLSSDESGYPFFPNCPKIREVNLQSLEKGESFRDCRKLTTLNIEKAKNLISFTNCELLTTINAPNAERIDAGNLCVGCTALTSVNMPKITEINYNAFKGCQQLSTFTFGDLTRIFESSFEDCILLQSIDLSKATWIDYMAFKGCTSLNRIGDLSAVTVIGYEAFSSTKINGKINIGKTSQPHSGPDGSSNAYIDYNVFVNTEITEVLIGKHIKVNSNAFNGTKITSVTVDDGCIINENAFPSLSTLKTVTLINCIVQSDAFYLCKEIEFIHINGRKLDLRMGCFDSIQACIYYHGNEDYYKDSTILVLNRIYKAVFVEDSYPLPTFCVIDVKKGDKTCPPKRGHVAFIIGAPDAPKANQEATCQECISNSKAAYLLAFFMQAGPDF